MSRILDRSALYDVTKPMRSRFVWKRYKNTVTFTGSVSSCEFCDPTYYFV